jgi:hypothetical protein
MRSQTAESQEPPQNSAPQHGGQPQPFSKLVFKLFDLGFSRTIKEKVLAMLRAASVYTKLDTTFSGTLKPSFSDAQTGNPLQRRLAQ